MTDRTYFQRVVQTGDFAVGDFQTGRVNGRSSVNLAYPVRDDQGRIAGVVFASLDLGWLNRLAAKGTPLLIEPVRVNEVLKAVYAEFSPRLNLRHIEWRAPEETVAIRADRMALVRVFRNFVDNALKYGGDPLSWIGIDYESSEAFHIFSIRNNGLGVREADEGKLFEVFHRGETSRGIEGSGLGLAIVREILERHGGRIWMEAAAGGACFRF